jgi:hypothetical protein
MFWKRLIDQGAATTEAMAGPLIRDDARARKILFDTFWTSAGWRDTRNYVVPPDDLEYAKAAGYMFDSRAGSHDDWVARAIRARDRVTLDEVVADFVSSLSSRRLGARSALGSMASVRHLAPHRFRNWSVHRCADCSWYSEGEDQNVLSFERHKWGGVRHGQITYAAFDLEIFARSERRPETAEDREILNAILNAARTAPPDARARDLERATAKLLPSSREERHILLGILALAGVLAPAEHPGLMTTWAASTERQPPPKPAKNDWLYPMFWWRGSTGVNEATAQSVFGDRLT